VAFLCWEQFNPAYNRELYNVKLGKNIDNEEKFLAAVKSGSWFAASVDDTLLIRWLDVSFLLDLTTKTGS
jgi:hypothetical protein